MAGAGYRVFSAGAVLTAAQVNTFLMEQSVMNFAGTAARGSALASVLSAGQMAHIGGGTVTVYDGSAWQQVYPSTAGGLVYLAGTAFSAVASVSVNNCFTSTYDNYRIMLLTTINGADDVYMRLRASGTDTSTNYNRQILLGETSSVAAARATAQTSIYVMRTSNATFRQSAVMDLFGPQIAGATTYNLTFANHQSATTPYVGVSVGNQSDSTQFDGLTLLSANNITGTVRVYGYRNS